MFKALTRLQQSSFSVRTYHNFYNGEFVPSKATRFYDVRSPVTQELIARSPQSTEEEFNAIVANNEYPKAYGKIFDSISICLSKGLGAPIGSLLLGNTEYIKKARRVRKVLGGGMRQAGYMAAAGLYALEHHIERLELDHIHAKQIAHALIRKNFVGHMLPVETNIVIFDITDPFTPIQFCDFMKSKGVYCLPISDTQVRMVTHLDVQQHQVNNLLDLIESMK